MTKKLVMYNIVYFYVSKSVPISMGIIPISVPKAKPMNTRTHEAWVWVQTDMGKDRVFYTHGLPISNTTDEELKPQ